MSGKKPILNISQLGKTVNSPEGKLTILEDINFTVDEAESLAIVGVSGSGKSTLLGLMAGLDVPSHGHVILDGQNLNELDEDGRASWRNERLGFVFQSFQLLNNLTALENVMLPLELAGSNDAAVEAKKYLDQVGLIDRIKHYPNQLSGGEQQRVAIARAFACKPKFLFADEPTGNLDQKTAALTIELLFEINQTNGTTLILVTHDAALAEHCDRILTIAGGRVIDLT